jgi:hypothetical protein
MVGLLFMSIEVLAIARRSKGLCWDINAPTLRPFAQKLKSAFLLGDIHGHTLCSSRKRLSSASSLSVPRRLLTM